MSGIIREYDSNGNIIYTKNSDGFESWHEYDANGNCVYSKHIYAYGYEVWHKGKMICYKMLYYKNSHGVKERYA